jgi:hypothetical protein
MDGCNATCQDLLYVEFDPSLTIGLCVRIQITCAIFAKTLLYDYIHTYL